MVATVCLTSAVLPLDFSGAAAATPAIARELGGSPLALAWVVNAFMLSFGSCVMAAGALADQLGRKRIFGIGISLFVLTSVAVSLAPTVAVLAAARAFLTTVTASRLSTSLRDPSRAMDSAERLAAGDMGDHDVTLLVHGYGEAFRALCLTLAGLTIVGATVAAFALSAKRPSTPPAPTAGSSAGSCRSRSSMYD